MKIKTKFETYHLNKNDLTKKANERNNPIGEILSQSVCWHSQLNVTYYRTTQAFYFVDII